MFIIPYCIYLRKSRADAEAEERGEGETLARHQKALLELAKKQNLAITKIYREIVSGETIAARPVMQELLQHVEQGIWNGVLVMEIERLARGDTIDQGIIAQTFKYSNTKIITPAKTYNPNNEFDEEYFEFGLFMSRREYKIINRRLQRGRIASIQEGKFVSNKAPYGYERIKLEKDKGYTLKIIPEQAEIIELIYNLYSAGELQNDGSYKRLGMALIAKKLNNMKIPTKTGANWSVATIRGILSNPVYIGKIRWNHRPNKKKMVDGKVKIERPRVQNDECIITNGLHPPIIKEETYNLVQNLIAKNPPRPINTLNVIKNPLSGIVKCGKCGHAMVRRPPGKKINYDTLICPYTYCDNISSKLTFVERGILKALKNWLDNYKLKWSKKADKAPSQIDIKRKAIKKIDNELEVLKKQLNNIHEFLEQEVYTPEQFFERSRVISEKTEQLKKNKFELEKALKLEIALENERKNLIPKIENLLEVYDSLSSAKAKNDMLKEIIEKAVYTKNINGRWNSSANDFEIVLFPKLPIENNQKNKPL